jgi:hypothetical protein
MPAPAIRYDGHAVDLSGRFFSSTAITGSPATNAETIVCTLTIGENVSLQQATYLFASVAFTVGTSGTGATLRIRQTNTSGTSLYSTGAQTVVATNLWETAGQGVDTAGTFPGQVYVVTLQITGGAAVSTVSAASLIAMVV